MNKWASLAATSLMIAALVNSALAQSRSDLPPYVSGPTWTGFYVGGDFGAGASFSRATAMPPGGVTTILDGAAGGGILASIHGGVDYQFIPQALVGVLAEGTWSNMTASRSAQVPGANASLSTQADLGFALLARAGILPTPSSLMYLTGGYAGQNFRTTGNAMAGGTAASFTNDNFFNGWTIGVGFESLLRGGWSTKIEYRYTQFESKFVPTGNVSVQPFMHTARVGLTYRFGAGHDAADAPVTTGRRDWTGIYGGVAGGAGVMQDKLNASFGAASASIDGGGQGLLGSVFLGGDYQFADHFLAGVLGDLTWPGMQSVLTVGGGGASATVASRTNMAWTLGGRVGYLLTPSALLYAMAGYTNQSFTTTGFAGNGSTLFSSDDRLSGFTVGPGLEFTIAPGWSTRLEYRYSQFETRMLFSGVTTQPSTHTVRAGLAYKFGAN
jgi:outer membrane immunogenic protein